MGFRGTSIRHTIGALLLLPVVSLVLIWAFATVLTVREAHQLLAVAAVADPLGAPAQQVVHAIQDERRQTLIYLADPRRADALSALQRTRHATDAVVGEIRERARGDARDDLNDSADALLTDLLEGLKGLEPLRGRVRNNTFSRPEALERYNEIVDPCFRFLSALHPIRNVELDRHSRAVVGVAQAREHLSREDALVAGALAAGLTTPAEVRAVGDRVAERQLTYATYLPDLPAADREAHESFWDGGRGLALTADEAYLLGSLGGSTSAVPADQWDRDTSAALAELRRLVADARDRYTAAVKPEAQAVLWHAGIAGVLGFLAVLVSLIVSLRIGRRLVRDLQGLAREARDAAEVRLPEVTLRLEAGEHVDMATEAPRLEYGRDEIGQVGRALNALQRAAVSAAVKRSRLRRGVSDVFVNLARRNQVLLHRQLRLLDTLKCRTENADDLAELHRLGHLTTRMRRHAEGLVILSGAAPARQWRTPVQLMDVVRAAVAEVEDYERVEVRRLPPLAVAGNAIADLTHLIAELLENATVFSPPHTAVQVTGERVPHGYTLEIHDRGLGLTSDALREVNERLAQPQDFDLSDTDRLGLFVVSRLAERLGARVALRESPYGGTTAVTLIPGKLLTETAEGPRRTDTSPEPHAPCPGQVDGPVELETSAGVAAVPTDRRAAVDGAPEVPEHPGGREPTPPLPRRRPTPVLVTDHGRPVGRAPDGPAEQSDAAAATAPEPGDQPPTTTAGLPRRVRRTERTPLRSVPAPEPTTDGAEPAERHRDHAEGRDAVAVPSDALSPDLDADKVRTRMAALQRGWQRGRQHTDTRAGTAPRDREGRSDS